MPEKYANTQYKDSFFKLIFGDNPEYALALYNAVNRSNYTDVENLKIVTLKDALFIGMKDDTAFIFHDVLSIFEHQSSYNPNMPLRGLGYFSDSYKEYIEMAFDDKRAIYSSRLMHIPAPQYYVLYNGPRDIDDHTLKLSDAYDGTGDIEIKAHLININKEKNSDLLQLCEPLRAYSEVVFRVRRNKARGLNDVAAVREAVNSCIEDGILVDILRRERARVENILISGISVEDFIDLRQKEFEEDLTIELTEKLTKEITEKLTPEITEKMEAKYRSELDNLQKELNMLKSELLKSSNQ